MNFIKTDFELLEKKFKEINSMNWIKVPKLGHGENGLLFENLLGLRRNDFAVPDYNDIEIKVQSRHSKFPITLFSLMLDGPEPMALQAFVSRYGVYDSKYTSSKVLYITLNSSNFTHWGKSLIMKLCCDTGVDRLYIHVAHANGKTIELKTYWEIHSIYLAFKRKLSNLCLVENETKIVRGEKYIKYTNAKFYKLTSYERFIEALASGKIFVKIKYGIYKHGVNAGKPYNHGSSFQIFYSDLPSIFEEII